MTHTKTSFFPGYRVIFPGQTLPSLCFPLNSSKPSWKPPNNLPQGCKVGAVVFQKAICLCSPASLSSVKTVRKKSQTSSIKRNHTYTQLFRKKRCYNKYSTGSLWKWACCTPKLQVPPHPCTSGLVPVPPLWKDIGGEHLSRDVQPDHTASSLGWLLKDWPPLPKPSQEGIIPVGSLLCPHVCVQGSGCSSWSWTMGKEVHVAGVPVTAAVPRRGGLHAPVPPTGETGIQGQRQAKLRTCMCIPMLYIYLYRCAI